MNPNRTLSRREESVLRLYARGFTVRQIADRLGMNFETVRSDLKRVRDATGRRTKAALAVYAVGAGIIEPKDMR